MCSYVLLVNSFTKIYLSNRIIRYPVFRWRVFSFLLEEQHGEFVIVFENACNSLPFQSVVNLKYIRRLFWSWTYIYIHIYFWFLDASERMIRLCGACVFRTEVWTLMYCMSQASPNGILNYVDLPFYSSAWFILSVLILSHKNSVIYKKVLCKGNNLWETKLAKTHFVNARWGRYSC